MFKKFLLTFVLIVLTSGTLVSNTIAQEPDRADRLFTISFNNFKNGWALLLDPMQPSPQTGTMQHYIASMDLSISELKSELELTYQNAREPKSIHTSTDLPFLTSFSDFVPSEGQHVYAAKYKGEVGATIKIAVNYFNGKTVNLEINETDLAWVVSADHEIMLGSTITPIGDSLILPSTERNGLYGKTYFLQTNM